MKIILSPMRRDDTLSLSKSSDTLIINGDAVDLSFVPDSTVLLSDDLLNDWIIRAERDGSGRLTVTMILPHAADASTETLFPEPLPEVADGFVVLPGMN